MTYTGEQPGERERAQRLDDLLARYDALIAECQQIIEDDARLRESFASLRASLGMEPYVREEQTR